MLSARSLYLRALANAYLGNKDDAERLEAKAEPLAMSGYGTVLDTPRLLLALHRGDLAAVESLLRGRRPGFELVLPQFDGRTPRQVGCARRPQAESRGGKPSASAGHVLEPFALRALGVVRGDRPLLERAAD